MAMVEEDERSSSLLDRELAEVADQILGTESRAPSLPLQIGPYTIDRLLGQGGMGTVYLASARISEHLVAIKILRDASFRRRGASRFAAEQRMLAQLNHPSIARLYDADTLPTTAPLSSSWSMWRACR